MEEKIEVGKKGWKAVLKNKPRKGGKKGLGKCKEASSSQDVLTDGCCVLS